MVSYQVELGLGQSAKYCCSGPLPLLLKHKYVTVCAFVDRNEKVSVWSRWTASTAASKADKGVGFSHTWQLTKSVAPTMDMMNNGFHDAFRHAPTGSLDHKS